MLAIQFKKWQTYRKMAYKWHKMARLGISASEGARDLILGLK